MVHPPTSEPEEWAANFGGLFVWVGAAYESRVSGSLTRSYRVLQDNLIHN
jgi:hypothetical protein